MSAALLSRNPGERRATTLLVYQGQDSTMFALAISIYLVCQVIRRACLL